MAEGTDEAGVSYDEVRRWIRGFAEAVAENKAYLTELDSAIGDADHGINMNRGMQATLAKLDGASGDDIGSLLKTVGMTLVSTVGGAGGPLYGTFFIQMGAAAAGKSRLTGDDWAVLRRQIREVRTHLDRLAPYTLCPDCLGQGCRPDANQGEPLCQGGGFISRRQYQQLSEEAKQRLTRIIHPRHQINSQ